MAQFELSNRGHGLELNDRFSVQKPLRVDFGSAEFLHRLEHAGKKSELVAKAVKVKPDLKVLDCTAGLGRDAFLMAWLGCEVTLLERSTVIALLLKDGLARAMKNERTADAANRMSILEDDAKRVLASGAVGFDVIYIDPMFPEKSGSAAVKGEMQQMQRFLGKDEDVVELLTLAIDSGCQRIVLKRPARHSWQSPWKPVHVFSNRNSQFEIYQGLSK
jgi:16S rRNA (guanine1516-N2)-methyltransferase